MVIQITPFHFSNGTNPNTNGKDSKQFLPNNDCLLTRNVDLKRLWKILLELPTISVKRSIFSKQEGIKVEKYI